MTRLSPGPLGRSFDPLVTLTCITVYLIFKLTLKYKNFSYQKSLLDLEADINQCQFSFFYPVVFGPETKKCSEIQSKFEQWNSLRYLDWFSLSLMIALTGLIIRGIYLYFQGTPINLNHKIASDFFTLNPQYPDTADLQKIFVPF
ncbi:MAG: hypothetical protein H0U57_07155 [Tatlockia sp.]|nr:hypothetical protein [Tatlockia sp.]